jgi:hypothetical protein
MLLNISVHGCRQFAAIVCCYFLLFLFAVVVVVSCVAVIAC